MKEIKTVVTEEHCFNIRDQPFFSNNLLKILDSQDSDASIKIIGFSIESSSTRVTLPIEILIDELKPGVADESQSE